MRYANSYHQGYLTVTLTREAAVCDMYAASDVTDPDAEISLLRRWRVTPRMGAGPLPALQDEGGAA